MALTCRAKQYALSQSNSDHLRYFLGYKGPKLADEARNNAAVVRELLPENPISYLEAACWLNDPVTVGVVAKFIDNGNCRRQALETLETIGTADALQALDAAMNLENIVDPRRLEEISAVAARLVKKLGVDPQKKPYDDITTVSAGVRNWFIITQRVQLDPQHRASYEAVKRHPGLARKLWIAEATRRLNLAAAGGHEEFESTIPACAVEAVADIVDSELVPVLKRITAESTVAVSTHGTKAMVKFYRVRSIAAKILTEKTGQVHEFIDVDGRRHPGCWNRLPTPAFRKKIQK